MDHEKITLGNMTKLFEFERFSRDIDSITDIEVLKNIARSYFKLYLKQQEVISEL